jgi:hypothetical protein
MKKRFSRLLIALGLSTVLALSLAVPAFAATTATVTVTATPEYLAMTNDTGNWTIGSLAEAATVYFTLDDLVPAEPLVNGDMKGTITNTGSVTSDVDIKCADFTGGVGWTLSADETPAANEVNLRAGITGMANLAAMIQVVNADTELIDSLAAAGTMKWCMILEAGTFTDGVAKSGTVTLTISKH